MQPIRDAPISDAHRARPGRPALASPGTPRWHALRTAPLREEAAEAQLRAHGVEAFALVEEREVRVRGRHYLRRVRLLPGYVFARFPGPVLWHVALDRQWPRRFISGVLCLAGGEPAVITEAGIAAIRAIASEEAARRAARKADAEAARRAATLRPGHVVHLPGVGTGEVVELIGKAGLRVRLVLFGAERLVLASSNDAVRADTVDP